MTSFSYYTADENVKMLLLYQQRGTFEETSCLKTWYTFSRVLHLDSGLVYIWLPRFIYRLKLKQVCLSCLLTQQNIFNDFQVLNNFKSLKYYRHMTFEMLFNIKNNKAHYNRL